MRLREPHQHAEGRVISARVQVIERVPTVRAIGGSATGIRGEPPTLNRNAPARIQRCL